MGGIQLNGVKQMILELILSALSQVAFFILNVSGTGRFPPPLSSKKEAEYIEKMLEGDEEAKRILIEHNLRLVAHIVKKYQGAEDSEDLISVGTIGLIKAINTFSADKGTQLATYTARCIENEILMLLRFNKKYANTVLLSDAVGTDKDGNELTLIDLLSDEDDSVIDKVERKIFFDKIMDIVKEVLDEREYKILVLRFGLKGGVPLAQREVASMLKISRSYISRLEKGAIEKIKQEMKNRNISPE